MEERLALHIEEVLAKRDALVVFEDKVRYLNGGEGGHMLSWVLCHLPLEGGRVGAIY